MVRKDCPAQHVLRAFNLGLLDDAQIETVGAHLDDCPACRGRLAAPAPAPADPVCRLVRRVDQAEAETPEAGLLRAEELVGRLDANSTTRTRGWADGTARPSPNDLAAEAGEVLAPPEAPGEIGRLGPFRVLEVIGCGGMGVVFRAADPRLGRTVAVKVLRPHAARQPELRDRFLAEARAVAAVRHDHVIPIYEIGAAAGRPYFVMAFVEGGTLAGELAAGPLEPRRAARLMREAAAAVAFSHARGIVHRDLKPGNVLLDAAGRAVVTDFGLAKRTDLGDGDVTLAGQVMGTPNYMPPEQAQGRGAEVGPPADVYALGATLYALLTGRPPFQAATPLETLRQVVELDPVPPRAVNPAVPRDLDTVCMTCLRKEPANRYPSAAAVADELGRYLDGKPILARPVGRLERGRKWARRNPAVAASLAGVVGVFLAAFALVTWSYLRADQAREDEAGQRRTAEANERAERWGRYRSDVAAASAALRLQNSGAARRALDDAPPEHRNWEWHHLHGQLDGAALVVPVPGGRVHALALSPSGRQFAVSCVSHPDVYLYDVATGRPDAVLRGHAAWATGVAYRPDGGQLATAAPDQTVRLWDPATGLETARFPIAGPPADPGRPAQVFYNADGTRLFSRTPFRTDRAGVAGRLWDATSGRELAAGTGRHEFFLPAAFRPDGHRVAMADGEFVHVHNAATGRRLTTLGPHPLTVGALHYSPDGTRIASWQTANTPGPHDSAAVGEYTTVRLWDAETGREAAELRGHTAGVATLRFSPDGARVVTAGLYPENTARLWDAATGRPLAVLAGHKNTLEGVAVSPDGTRIVTTSLDQTARLWDGRTGRPMAVLGGHTGQVWHAVFSPTGARIVTASEDATLRLWDADTGELLAVLRGHGGEVTRAAVPAFTPDGSRLVTGSWDGTVRVWDTDLAERNGILRGHESYVYDAAFGPDGERVASAAWDGTVRLWDATTGRQTGLFRHETKIVNSVSFGRDGRRLAANERDRGVTVRDTAAAAPPWFVPMGFDEGGRVALSPDGTLLAAATGGGTVRLWYAAARRELAPLVGHEGSVADVAFRPDGRQLASTGHDTTVCLWDVASRARVAVLRGHTRTVWRVAFSADGALLASGSADNTVRLWDARTHEQLAVIPVGSTVYGVAFGPDGTRLAAGCRDNTIRLFDVARRQQVAELHGHTDYVHSVGWSPDGTRLVSGSGDHTVRVWDSLSAQDRARRTAGPATPRE